MIDKLNQFLFSKVNSSYSQEELTILYNTLYLQHKEKKGNKKFLIEDDFKTFATNFHDNLTEEQKNDFKNIAVPKKGLFKTLFDGIVWFQLIEKKYKTTEEGQTFYERFKILSEIQKEIFKISFSKNKQEVFKFSQTDIANEFGVDIKTYSKWLELVDLKEKYFGRRQLSFYEYKEIFRKLFTESDEDFNLKNKFEEYTIRLEEKKTLSKKDIIRLGFELIDNPKVADYERAQEIIQDNDDFDFYHTIDKYPYAIAIKIINYLKSNS